MAEERKKLTVPDLALRQARREHAEDLELAFGEFRAVDDRARAGGQAPADLLPPIRQDAGIRARVDEVLRLAKRPSSLVGGAPRPERGGQGEQHLDQEQRL